MLMASSATQTPAERAKIPHFLYEAWYQLLFREDSAMLLKIIIKNHTNMF